MKTLNARRIFAVAVASMLLPAWSHAVVSVCVKPDAQAKDGCISLSALGARLRLPDLHAPDGNLTDDVVVRLEPGTYRIDRAIQIDRTVTGPGKKLLTITGSSAADTIISGGRALTLRKPTPAEAKGLTNPERIWVATYTDSASPIPPFVERRFGKGGSADVELFLDSKRMPVARWPNEGPAVTGARSANQGPAEFSPAKAVDGFGRYTSEPDARIGGYLKYDWAYELLSLKAVDTGRNTFILHTTPTYGIGDQRRFWVENAVSDIDRPGEWAVRREQKLIYFWPPSEASGQAEVSYADAAFEVKGATNLHIENLGFTEFRGTAILMQDVIDSSVKSVSVTNTGFAGINMSGLRSGASGVNVSSTGAAAIVISGGDRKTLTPGGMYVENSELHDVAVLYRTYTPAVFVMGVGNRVVDSKLYNGPHSAIIFHGNDHLISGNTISKFVLETDDAGAIYTGRDWTARGTKIVENVIQDIGGNAAKIGAKGVYLDDQASGITVEGNLFRNVPECVFAGGGRDNTVSGNIFQNSGIGFSLDARGRPRGRDPADVNKALMAQLKSFNVARPPYSVSYPHLADLEADSPGMPKYNLLENNIYINTRPTAFRDDAQAGVDVRDNRSTATVPAADILPGQIKALRQKIFNQAVPQR